MKPVRYNKDEIEVYLREGYWDTTILPDYWEQNAEKWPDKEALIDTLGNRLTWRMSAKAIDRIALSLVKVLELKRDDVLIVQLPNRIEQVLVRLACEKAGVLSLPVMTTFRQSELEAIGRLTGAVGAVIQKQYRQFDHYDMIKHIQDKLPAFKYIIVAGDEVPDDGVSLDQIMTYPYETEYDPTELIDRKMDPVEEVGFLNTTTGTTGAPKLIEHRIAAREIWTGKCHARNWRLSPDDIVLAIAPIAGAAGGTPAYITAPIGGAKIALEYQYNGEETLVFIEKEGVTLMALVPTQLGRLLDLPVDKYDMSSLRIIKTAGGYLAPSLAKKAEEIFGCPILGTYGTQDTGSISGVPVDADEMHRMTTVGKLHPGIEIKILDKDGSSVKPGDVGTLWFKGPGNSIGYFKDLKKTMKEAFDQEGFATPGDLVKLMDDGYLKIVGRKKNIIIRGGQNIYPREIEDYLMAYPKIANVAVVPIPDNEMGERACACVELKQGEVFTFEDMIRYLKSKKIAAFKLPERLEILDIIPLVGESGKIDKKEMARVITERMLQERK